MLPEFDENGNLPPGIHVATIEEVIQRFSHPHWGIRLQRSKKLVEFIGFTRPFAVGLYINGSYITTKRAPKDVDVAVVLPENFDTNSMDAHLLERRQRKGKKEGDLDIFYYVRGTHNDRLQKLLNIWSYDRDGNQKGIVYVEARS